MKTFNTVCDTLDKDANGHLGYIVDLSNYYKDELVTAYLVDEHSPWEALMYKSKGEDYRNEVYQSVEHVITDLIDKYNDSVDAKMYHEERADDGFADYRQIDTDQAMHDAGHKHSDF